jgi:hypothetical protein
LQSSKSGIPRASRFLLPRRHNFGLKDMLRNFQSTQRKNTVSKINLEHVDTVGELWHVAFDSELKRNIV